MLKKTLTYILTATASALTAGVTSSCGDEGIDGRVEMALTDIVTFEGNTNGNNATFTLVKVDDTPAITLTADRPVIIDSDDDKDAPPVRMLISYIPADGMPYSGGPVRLLSASRITQAPVATEWKDEYDSWNAYPVYVYSMWRSGSWINLHMRITYSDEPRIFCLATDPATISSETPDLYLVHVLENPVNNHDRSYYASFDISSVWDLPHVKGVNVHVANSNLHKHIFTFQKTGL